MTDLIAAFLPAPPPELAEDTLHELITNSEIDEALDLLWALG